jgi:VanZ family protein
LSDLQTDLSATELRPAGGRLPHIQSDRPQGSLFWAWLPAILWLCVIAVESSDWLSSEHTSRILFPIVRWMFGLTYDQFVPLHAVLRKLGHVFGYGFLSLLLYRAWRGTISVAGSPRWSMVWARMAVFMTAFAASLDEWHQSFIPSRTGSVHDVILDTGAALAAQLGLYLFFLRRRS